MLREKLQLADDRMEISKGVSVSKEAKALIVKKAKEVANKQFNASHAPSRIALKDEFFPHSQAKRNDTILTALIRACTSRRVTISNVAYSYLRLLMQASLSFGGVSLIRVISRA